MINSDRENHIIFCGDPEAQQRLYRRPCNMWRLYKSNMKMLKTNFGALVWFEVLYKLLAAVSLYPLILFLLNFSIEKAGLNYLTNTNLQEFLGNPLSIAMIVFIVTVIVIYSLFELVVLTICYEMSHNGEKTNVITLIITGIKRLWRVLRPESIFLFLLVLAAAVLFDLPFTSSLVSMTALSDYMSLFWGNHHFFYIAAIIVEIIILYLISFSLFSVHYLIIENRKFTDSLKASRNLVRGETIQNAFHIAVWFLFLFTVLAVVYACFNIAAAYTVKFVWPPDAQVAAFLSAARIITQIMTIIIYTVFTPLAYLMISSIFYAQKESRKEPLVSVIHPRSGKKMNKWLAALLALVLIVSVVLNFDVINLSLQSSVLRNIQLVRIPTITAHRGSSVEAPENTLSAIQKAADELADYAEIDVRATKDNIVVLLHDDSLKRTTGVDKKIWDITYEETQKLDVGSWLSDKYFEERIPTLDEIIKFSDGKIMLNIEIKTSEYNPNLEESVVRIIQDNHFEDKCIISTFSYPVLARIKAMDPDIRTGIIMNVAFADYLNLSNVDFYSLNAQLLTRDQVEKLHILGYEVYAWNVVNSVTAKRVMNMGVDSIITSDTLMSKEIVYTASANWLVLKITEFIFGKTDVEQSSITNFFLPYW